MNVSVSVGVIVGSLISSVLVQHVRGGIVAVSFYVLMSIGALGAALAPWILARMAFLAISLLALPAGNAVINGFQSLLINKEHMGRVFAGMGMIETIAAPAITFLSGIAMQPTLGLLSHVRGFGLVHRGGRDPCRDNEGTGHAA